MSTSGNLPEPPEFKQLYERLFEPSEHTHKKSIGRFKTDSARKEFAAEVKDVRSKLPRYKSNNPSSLLKGMEEDPLSYAQKLFRKIIDGLMLNNLQTSRMQFSHFEWLLPGPYATPQQLLTYDLLQACPMVVSNSELSSILNLERSTEASPPTGPGSHLYMRSWILTGAELSTLIQYMRSQDMLFEELEAWESVLDVWFRSHSEAPSVFTIRYIGICDGPKRPIDRHIEDLTQRKYSLFVEFMGALQACLPHVFQNTEIYLISDASIDPDSYLPIDDVERVGIQFFDHTTLLNRQRGGFYSSYVPSAQDADTFRDLGTDFWHSFRETGGLPRNAMVAKVTSHFQAVQQYANGNPGETGTGNYRFTDTYREVIEQQATPLQYQGHTIIAFIGKDVTLDEYVAESPFIKGSSRAGRLTRDFIHRLVHYEAQANNRVSYEGPFKPESGPWCFVDLWPWLTHKNKPKAAEFLQNYLQITQPLIAVTYSRPVNELVRSNFQNENGVKMNTFTSIVGKPTIQYYDYDTDGNPDEDSAFINIPHIHPGRDKYGDQDITLRRVFDLTMQYTFLVSDVAIKVVDRWYSQNLPGIDEPPKQKELCDQILAEVDRLCSDSDSHKRFFESLEKARKDLLSHWGKTFSYRTQEERPVLNEEGRRKLAGLGQAVGKPNSDERKQQLNQLWEEDIADLHVLVPREEGKTKWMKSLLNVPQHQFYYLHIVAHIPPEPYTGELLGEFKPQNAGQDWMNDEQARHQAAVAAGLWLSEQLEKDDAVENVGGKTPEKYLSPRDCQGRSVKFNSDGEFKVRWIEPGTEILMATKMWCTLAVPKGPNSPRYVYFTKDGVDVLGPGNESFRATHFGNKIASASVTLPKIVDKPDALSLWRQVCDAHKISTGALQEEVEAVEWGPAGTKALNNMSNKLDPKQKIPPNPTDAIWLLQKFIDERENLALGGVFHTADKDKFPDSTEDLQGFLEFLRQPAYCKHPYANFWIGKLSREKPETVVLAKNLPLLRDTRADRRQEKSKGLRVETKRTKGVHVHELYFTLGAKGSALDNPFEEGSDQSCLSKRKSEYATSGKGGKDKKKKSAEDSEEEDVEEEEAEEDEQVTLKPAKTSKKRKSSRAEISDEDTTVATPKKRRRSQPKTASKDSDDEPIAPKPATKRKRKSVGDDEGQGEDEVGEQTSMMEQPSKKKKTSLQRTHTSGGNRGGKHY
ncbi:hypothetical protein PRZ48_007637 [Zasmidium cellare]|uniref:Uncharacterized protein n=1 Tax=Zasmidium cellare TaxID=395010 RepID=A0ABR0EKT8_ZASCE|nr:hypothetical protein PRZ48_007637 [Zasmidium cellare]